MRRAAILFAVAPLAVLLVGIATGRAADTMTAVALSCSADLPGPDCSRDTALDVVSQPASAGACPLVAQVLATHLDLPPGGYHKTRCERRGS